MLAWVGMLTSRRRRVILWTLPGWTSVGDESRTLSRPGVCLSSRGPLRAAGFFLLFGQRAAGSRKSTRRLGSEPARRRTLRALVHDAREGNMSGNEIRVCNGTQQGWYATTDDESKKESGFIVLAINAKHAMVAGYTHPRSSPEDAGARRALLNACVM